MTAAERLRAMARGHGHCVVPRGVLRDIAVQAERELAEAAKRPACEMAATRGTRLCSEWRCSACGKVSASAQRPRYCCWCGAEAAR